MDEEAEGRVGMEESREDVEVQSVSEDGMDIEVEERFVLSNIEKEIIRIEEGAKSKNKKAIVDLHKIGSVADSDSTKEVEFNDLKGGGDNSYSHLGNSYKGYSDDTLEKQLPIASNGPDALMG